MKNFRSCHLVTNIAAMAMIVSQVCLPLYRCQLCRWGGGGIGGGGGIRRIFLNEVHPQTRMSARYHMHFWQTLNISSGSDSTFTVSRKV